MGKTILAETSGFTPVIDGVLDELGSDAALVFGVIWRYCQMGSGVCYASLETIANRLRKERKYVIRHLAVLVKYGFLKDVTLQYHPEAPTIINKNGEEISTGITRMYADTGKAQIIGSIVAGVFGNVEMDDSLLENEDNRQNNPSQNGIAQNGIVSTYTHPKKGPGLSHKGFGGNPKWVGSHPKKGSHKETIQETIKEKIKDDEFLEPSSPEEFKKAQIYFNSSKLELQDQVSQAFYNTWVKSLYLLQFDSITKQVVVGVFNSTTINELKANGADQLLSQIIKNNWSPEISIAFCVSQPAHIKK